MGPVIPWQTVDRAAAPDGGELVLARRGEEWAVRAGGGGVLMTSRQHGSEEALAELALARAARRGKVLVGGLGLGYTLRAVLDRVPVDARVVLVELVPALVAWSRAHVGHLAGRPLDDPRVRLQQGDVLARIAEAKGAYDAILLDVDNGPTPLVRAANEGLYSSRGIAACRDALRKGGALGVWSAGPDEGYRARLARAGLEVEVREVTARGGSGRGARHVLFLGRRAAR